MAEGKHTRVLAQETLDYFAGMRGDEITEIEATAGALAKAYLAAIDSHADLLAAADAIIGKANPQASVINGKVTHYRIDKPLMDALRAAIAKAKGGAA